MIKREHGGVRVRTGGPGEMVLVREVAVAIRGAHGEGVGALQKIHLHLGADLPLARALLVRGPRSCRKASMQTLPTVRV